MYKRRGGVEIKLKTLITLLEVLPISSAECERGFSQMNLYHTAVASEAICKWGGIMPARSAGRKFFDVPPHFSLVPPHMRGHNDCLLPTERQLKCPLVSALQSAHPLVKSGEGQ